MMMVASRSSSSSSSSDEEAPDALPSPPLRGSGGAGGCCFLPPSYQRTVVRLDPSATNNLDGDNNGPPESWNFPRNRRCRWASGLLLLLALSSFAAASVGWLVLTAGAGGGGGGMLLHLSGEAAEADMAGSGNKNSWAQYLHPKNKMGAPNNTVRAKDARGDKVEAVSVIVIKSSNNDGDSKEEDGAGGGCEDDCRRDHEHCRHKYNKKTKECGGKRNPAPETKKFDARCAAVPACAHLAGDCCPTADGAVLSCCGVQAEAGTSNTAPAPIAPAPPTAAPAAEASCAAHPACAQRGLTGDCCPTAGDNVFLHCCSINVKVETTQEPTPVPSESPSSAEPTRDASCAAHPACADLELTGDCCPTGDGVVLDCCRRFTESPKSNEPSEAPSVVAPMESPSGSPFEASCAAHPACADLELTGDCCPTADDVVLDCCFWTESPSQEPSEAPSAPPSERFTKAPAIAVVPTAAAKEPTEVPVVVIGATAAATGEPTEAPAGVPPMTAAPRSAMVGVPAAESTGSGVGGTGKGYHHHHHLHHEHPSKKSKKSKGPKESSATWAKSKKEPKSKKGPKEAKAPKSKKGKESKKGWKSKKAKRSFKTSKKTSKY